jgi:hypothetical protein
VICSSQFHHLFQAKLHIAIELPQGLDPLTIYNNVLQVTCSSKFHYLYEAKTILKLSLWIALIR